MIRVMPSQSPAHSRHFLSWERPWLRQAVEWLAGESQDRPIDLSGVLAVVPTRQSGRRLREELAHLAAERRTAAFAPRVHTPDTLLAPAAESRDIATRLEALLAWTDVLRDVALAEVREVFPVEPPRRDFAWAWRLAETFFALQTQLNESGLEFADVAQRTGAGFPEASRWEQLAGLERRQQARLAQFGKREPHAARREFARNAELPDGVERVVVLAAPDPLPLAVDMLRQWAKRVPVSVVVFAPQAEAEAFDEWGRPKPEVWTRGVIELTEFERRVHLCADPADEAQVLAEAVRQYAPAADAAIAVGVADPEVLPLLENALSRAGLQGYNPEGRMRRGDQWHGLLAALAGFARETSYEAVAALARCPDLLRGIQDREGPNFSAAGFLQQLDKLRADYLPADLAALRRVAALGAKRGSEVVRGIEFLAELQRVLAGADFGSSVMEALRMVFRTRRFNLEDPDEAVAAESAEAWRDVVRDCGKASEQFPELKPADWWAVALSVFGAQRRTEDKPAGAIDLQGWLELLWEEAPHLAVAGCNDGFVPDAIVGDAFLPESLRERLGLKTNAARFARDAYILRAMAEARRVAGRLDVLLAKNSSVGDPLRPSRLLLRCADEELPGRIAQLFRGAETVRQNLPWRRAWKLAPRRERARERVAVTGLRMWLACPFRFYLQHVLRMEAVDPAKSELDARDFGTLCHAALEAMAREPAMRDCTDEAALREFLLGRLDAEARKRFGEELTLPLVVQLESARQRLGRAAAVQARERKEGWVIMQAEREFELELGGLTVRGKIDRCDRHEGSGAWRVLDYKTTDSGPTPHKAHLRPMRVGDEQRPSWMRVELAGREQVWADLQLALYVRALGRESAGAPVTCGYFNLPKAVGETAIVTWSELTTDLLAAADRCAEEVAAAIRTGEFWPPAEVPADWDAFAELFHHGAAESVAWEEAR